MLYIKILSYYLCLVETGPRKNHTTADMALYNAEKAGYSSKDPYDKIEWYNQPVNGGLRIANDK